MRPVEGRSESWEFSAGRARDVRDGKELGMRRKEIRSRKFGREALMPILLQSLVQSTCS